MVLGLNLMKAGRMEIIDKGRIFKNRRDAGIELGKILERKYKNKEALVLAIPRGGIVVAYEVSKILNAELSVIITKKLPHPLQEELAVGAAAEDGSFYLTSLGKTMERKTLESILLAQEKEIQSRIQRFRKGNPLPEMKNRIVILTDDGIATGSTIVPAIQLCKKRKAAMVIVAAPVSGEKYVSEIDELADEVIIAEQPETFLAVGQVYEDFHHLSDEEVIELLEDFKQSASKN
jgi:predicted phosphoribosyltransferase